MKLHTLLCALLAGAALAAAEKALPVTPETYQPDFSESDIYLPYLKRTPLWGWWDVRKVTSDRKNDPNDEGTRSVSMRRTMTRPAGKRILFRTV